MLPRINITSQSGKIDISVTPARVERKTGQKQLDISGNGRVKVNITSTQSQLHIDQTACFASVGLKKPIPLALDFYSESFQKGMENIGTIVNEGLEFLAIQNNTNPISNQAKRIGTDEVQLSVRSLPAARPEINFQPGSLDIQVADDSVNIQWQNVDGEFSYVPCSVNISMAQYPTLEITLEPGKEFVFHTTSVEGINVDQAV